MQYAIFQVAYKTIEKEFTKTNNQVVLKTLHLDILWDYLNLVQNLQIPRLILLTK